MVVTASAWESIRSARDLCLLIQSCRGIDLRQAGFRVPPHHVCAVAGPQVALRALHVLFSAASVHHISHFAGNQLAVCVDHVVIFSKTYKHRPPLPFERPGGQVSR